MRSRFPFLTASVLAASPGFAQGNDATQAPAPSQPDTYTPRVGEQPVFGKKFTPNEPRSNFVLEVNPLLLLRRGIGIEGEARVGEKFSLGGDLVFQGGQVFSEAGVTADASYVGAAVKFRMYPLDSLAGVFFGAKLSLGSASSQIVKGNDSVKSSGLAVAPAAHAGYRVTNFGGFTLAVYVGGGANLLRNEISASQLNFSAALSSDPAVAKAREQVNKDHGVFRFDYGLTLGAAF